jgi:hypothetical protein
VWLATSVICPKGISIEKVILFVERYLFFDRFDYQDEQLSGYVGKKLKDCNLREAVRVSISNIGEHV